MIREEILKELKKKDAFISGEELRLKSGVSRMAISKNIKILKEMMYEIETSTKKGYKLIPSKDILTEYEINDIKTKTIGKNIIFKTHVDSTNNLAKEIALNDAKEGTVVVAEIQTEGRGRLGKKWKSESEKGIWMSIVLKPKIHPEKLQTVTLAAAVSVANTIKNLYGITVGIKWPNDILIDNKKVCGILTEMNCEADMINFVVVGIGINVNQDKRDFPKEIKNIATSIKMNRSENDYINRSEIIKRILLEFEGLYNKVVLGDSDYIISEWKKYPYMIGKKITAEIDGKMVCGTAKDISADGRLVLECPNGEVKYISSGEISVSLKWESL